MVARLRCTVLTSRTSQVLVDHADTISGRLGPQAENAECDAARASAPASSAGTSTAGAADGGPAAGEKLFRLGDDTDKHASVNTFKGRPYINLRQHYPKDGKWLPGKKGISLTVDQFRELQKHAPVRTGGAAHHSRALFVSADVAVSVQCVLMIAAAVIHS